MGLRVSVDKEGAPGYPQKRRVRAIFSLAGHNYNLVVTDPMVEREYLGKSDGTYEIANAVMCVSLGELFGG